MKVKDFIKFIHEDTRLIFTDENGRVLKDFESSRDGIEKFEEFNIIYCRNSYYPRRHGGDSSCLSVAIKEVV